MAAFMGAGSASAENLHLCAKCQKGVVKDGGKCGFCGKKDAIGENTPVVAVASLCGQGGGGGDFCHGASRQRQGTAGREHG